MELPIDRDRIIDSGNKRPGWEAFLNILPHVTRSKGSTRRELIGIHEVVTYGAEIPAASPDMEGFFMSHLLFNDNARGDRVLENLREHFRGQLREDLLTRYNLRNVKLGFEPQLQVDIRSDIRRVGFRNYQNGRRDEIFYMNVRPFYGEDEQGREIELLCPRLTYKLGDVYRELCDRYDAMWNRATDPKQKLLAELYLQMVGMTFVHPFFDGNSRTFNAHLVLAFNRMGFPVRKIPKEEDMNEFDETDRGIRRERSYDFLENLNAQFLCDALGEFFLKPQDRDRLLDLPSRKYEFMKRLHVKILEMVQRGILGTQYEPYILHAYHLVRVWLHYSGFWDYPELLDNSLVLYPQNNFDLSKEELKRLQDEIEQNGGLSVRSLRCEKFKI